VRIILGLIATLTIATPALAAAGAETCPAGKLQRVRVSEIVADGSMAGFKAAFADHARWYAEHGYKADSLSMAPVVGENGARRGRKGAVRVVTIHTGVSQIPRDKQDDAWKAFAAKYKANSRIVSTTLTCTA
jgi:hypothetical protein